VPARTKAERQRNGRLGAWRQWSRTPDRAAHTAPARAASAASLQARFEAEVDPAGELDPVTRAELVEYRRKEYFARLAFASAKARRAKAAKRKAGEGRA
jgi:hypothetical protein